MHACMCFIITRFKHYRSRLLCYNALISSHPLEKFKIIEMYENLQQIHVEVIFQNN